MLLFDLSSMQPEELERAIGSGYDYISKRLTPADLVAIAAVGSTLQIIQDFTADREVLSAALSAAVRNVLLYRSLVESIEEVAEARRQART